MSGLTKALISLAIAGLLAGAALSFFALDFLSVPASESNDEIVFEVKPGMSFKTISQELEYKGLVKSALKLQIYARLTAKTNKMRIGEYMVRRDLKPGELLKILSSGQSIQYFITVSEGLNRFEIADIFAKQNLGSRDEFLELTSDPRFVKELLGRPVDSLEGYLFPDTYFITKYIGAKGLIRVMVEKFKENFARARTVPGWTLGNLSEHELVTLASIIEKETGAPEERPVISSVFHNRLRRKTPLQTDPTVIYGIWRNSGSWNGAISRMDLRARTPYNTYVIPGLPPGPISNPGFEALKAAGAPAESEYMFFVSRNDGTHVFSETYALHLKAVERFQLDRRAREGKSWRDLNKRQASPPEVKTAPPARTKSR